MTGGNNWVLMTAAIVCGSIAAYEHETGDVMEAALWGWVALVALLFGMEP